MATVHDFLERLGLGQDADARAIRRAYARALKQVDQERDPAGFQHLRECYEAALDWAAWEERRRQAGEEADEAAEDGVAEPVPVSAGMADSDGAMPTPFETGRALFEEFLAAMPALIALRRDPPQQPWIEALERALADERLFNLDARLGFELHVAHLLANGWRPGHDMLFPAAAKVFGWEDERRSLARLGEAGYMLDIALDQRMGFGTQDLRTRTRQRDVLALLRQAEPPSNKRVLRQMEALDQLMRRFPGWMAVMAPFGRAEEWRERYEQLEGRPFDAEDPAHAERRGRWAKAAGWTFRLVFMLVVLNWSMPWIFPWYSGHSTTDKLERAEAARQHAERLRHPKPIYEDEPPPLERTEDIAKRIAYQPGPTAQAGKYTVSFQVLLDADGSVLGANRLRESGDRAFDAAVKQAILTSKPFPPKTAKVFGVTYSMTVKRGRKTLVPGPALGESQFKRTTMPWERPAAPSGNHAPDDGKPRQQPGQPERQQEHQQDVAQPAGGTGIDAPDRM
jgi:protein TonB